MIADLPSWMDASFLRAASGTLVIVAVVLTLVILFVVRSLGTRIVAIVLLGAAVFGLVHYRNTLENCDRLGCGCKLFGQSVPSETCKTTG